MTTSGKQVGETAQLSLKPPQKKLRSQGKPPTQVQQEKTTGDVTMIMKAPTQIWSGLRFMREGWHANPGTRAFNFYRVLGPSTSPLDTETPLGPKAPQLRHKHQHQAPVSMSEAPCPECHCSRKGHWRTASHTGQEHRLLSTEDLSNTTAYKRETPAPPRSLHEQMD